MSYSQTLSLTCDPKVATRYAQVLLGCFRRGEAEDGPTYVRAVVAILTGYPEAIVRDVCDPRRGLPVKNNFLPTLYEVKSACDERMRPLLEAERVRRIREETEADRPREINPIEADRRKFIVAKWSENQAVRDAASAGAGLPLADMDARQLKGEHREIVTKAINGNLAALQAECVGASLKLSPAALRAIAPELVDRADVGSA